LKTSGKEFRLALDSLRAEGPSSSDCRTVDSVTWRGARRLSTKVPGLFRHSLEGTGGPSGSKLHAASGSVNRRTGKRNEGTP